MYRYWLLLNVTNTYTLNTKKYTFITEKVKYLNNANQGYVLITYMYK